MHYFELTVILLLFGIWIELTCINRSLKTQLDIASNDDY